jgi:hypothetical protein
MSRLYVNGRKPHVFVRWSTSVFLTLSREGTPKAYLIFIEEEKKVIYKKPGVLQAVTPAHTAHTH